MDEERGERVTAGCCIPSLHTEPHTEQSRVLHTTLLLLHSHFLRVLLPVFSQELYSECVWHHICFTVTL